MNRKNKEMIAFMLTMNIQDPLLRARMRRELMEK